MQSLVFRCKVLIIPMKPFICSKESNFIKMDTFVTINGLRYLFHGYFLLIRDSVTHAQQKMLILVQHMIIQGCLISCGTVVFFQKSRNLSLPLLSNNNFYCATQSPMTKATSRAERARAPVSLRTPNNKVTGLQPYQAPSRHPALSAHQAFAQRYRLAAETTWDKERPKAAAQPPHNDTEANSA